MIRFLSTLLFLFFVSGVSGQIKDSVEVTIKIDTMSIVQSLDSSFIATKDYPRNIKKRDSVDLDSLRTPPKMLTIERALLDSLLKPYYNINIDSTI